MGDDDMDDSCKPVIMEHHLPLEEGPSTRQAPFEATTPQVEPRASLFQKFKRTTSQRLQNMGDNLKNNHKNHKKDQDEASLLNDSWKPASMDLSVDNNLLGAVIEEEQQEEQQEEESNKPKCSKKKKKKKNTTGGKPKSDDRLIKTKSSQNTKTKKKVKRSKSDGEIKKVKRKPKSSGSIDTIDDDKKPKPKRSNDSTDNNDDDKPKPSKSKTTKENTKKKTTTPRKKKKKATKSILKSTEEEIKDSTNSNLESSQEWSTDDELLNHLSNNSFSTGWDEDLEQEEESPSDQPDKENVWTASFEKDSSEDPPEEEQRPSFPVDKDDGDDSPFAWSEQNDEIQPLQLNPFGGRVSTLGGGGDYQPDKEAEKLSSSPPRSVSSHGEDKDSNQDDEDDGISICESEELGIDEPQVYLVDPWAHLSVDRCNYGDDDENNHPNDNSMDASSQESTKQPRPTSHDDEDTCRSSLQDDDHSIPRSDADHSDYDHGQKIKKPNDDEKDEGGDDSWGSDWDQSERTKDDDGEDKLQETTDAVDQERSSSSRKSTVIQVQDNIIDSYEDDDDDSWGSNWDQDQQEDKVQQATELPNNSVNNILENENSDSLINDNDDDAQSEDDDEYQVKEENPLEAALQMGTQALQNKTWKDLDGDNDEQSEEEEEVQDDEEEDPLEAAFRMGTQALKNKTWKDLEGSNKSKEENQEKEDPIDDSTHSEDNGMVLLPIPLEPAIHPNRGWGSGGWENQVDDDEKEGQGTGEQPSERILSVDQSPRMPKRHSNTEQGDPPLETKVVDRKLVKKKLQKVQKMLIDIVKTEGKSAPQNSNDYKKWLKKAKEYSKQLGLNITEKELLDPKPSSKDPVALMAWRYRDKMRQYEKMGAEEVTQVTKKQTGRVSIKGNQYGAFRSGRM